MHLRRILFLVLSFATAAAAPTLAKEPVSVSAAPVHLDPRDPQALAVGALDYRGGLALRSGDPRFGGFSGIHVSDDGASLLARLRLTGLLLEAALLPQPARFPHAPGSAARLLGRVRARGRFGRGLAVDLRIGAGAGWPFQGSHLLLGLLLLGGAVALVAVPRRFAYGFGGPEIRTELR